MASNPNITEEKKKKTTAKKVKKTVKKTARKRKSRKKKSNTPFFILAIMFLTAMVILLLTKVIKKHNAVVSNPSNKNEVTNSEKIIPKGKNDNINYENDDNLKNKLNDNSNNRNDKNKTQVPEVNLDITPVKIYLIHINDNNDGIKVVPVRRKVSKENILLNTYKALIKGPVSDEIKNGYISSFPAGLDINNIYIKGRILYLDFNNKFSINAFGDIIINRINQILLTSRQFKGVDGITLLINGKRVSAIGGDGRIFSWPIKRRL